MDCRRVNMPENTCESDLDRPKTQTANFNCCRSAKLAFINQDQLSDDAVNENSIDGDSERSTHKEELVSKFSRRR